MTKRCRLNDSLATSRAMSWSGALGPSPSWFQGRTCPRMTVSAALPMTSSNRSLGAIQPAMLGGDPVCLHRAAFRCAHGLLDFDGEPVPETPLKNGRLVESFDR